MKKLLQGEAKLQNKEMQKLDFFEYVQSCLEPIFEKVVKVG